MEPPPIPPAAKRRRRKIPRPSRRPWATLPDDILSEVLVLVPCPSDLIHCAAACRAFFRLVSSPAFRRHLRIRRCGAAPFLGAFTHPRTSHVLAASPPFSSLSLHLRRAVSHLDLGFISPHRRSFSIADSRDGRLLLITGDDSGDYPAQDFFVCNPLAGSCTQLPPPPNCATLYYLAAGYLPDEASHGYRVVLLFPGSHHSQAVSFRVYSSRTGAWVNAYTTTDFPMPPRRDLRQPSVLAGRVWYLLRNAECVIAVDLSAMQIAGIALPWPAADAPDELKLKYTNHALGKTADGRLCLVVLTYLTQLRVWVYDAAADGNAGSNDAWVERVEWRRELALNSKFLTLVGCGEGSGVVLINVNGRVVHSVHFETGRSERLRNCVHMHEAFVYEMEWPPTSRHR